jgi:hypothetical protein
VPGPYLNKAWSRILGRSSAGSTLDDVEGAFDDPAPLQDPKSLALPRPFHDRKGTLRNSGYPFNQLAVVTSVSPDEFQPRNAGDPREYMFGSITVLDPGAMKKQAQNVDDDVALAPS